MKRERTPFLSGVRTKDFGKLRPSLRSLLPLTLPVYGKTMRCRTHVPQTDSPECQESAIFMSLRASNCFSP